LIKTLHEIKKRRGIYRARSLKFTGRGISAGSKLAPHPLMEEVSPLYKRKPTPLERKTTTKGGWVCVEETAPSDNAARRGTGTRRSNHLLRNDLEKGCIEKRSKLDGNQEKNIDGEVKKKAGPATSLRKQGRSFPHG